MLRLTAKGYYELWRCSTLVASCVNKRSVLSPVPVSRACFHRIHLLNQHFNTGSQVRKDEPIQPREDKRVQTIDLDKWKSVMRSQVASEEKQHVNDEEEASDGDDDDEDDDDDEKTGSDASSLDGMRELVTMWRHAGKFVPEEISDEELQILAELTTKSARKKHLKFLAIKENHKRTRREKQKIKRETWLQKSEEELEAEEEKKRKSLIFYKFWSHSEDRMLAWRGAQALMFNQPLVFDMSYDTVMNRKDLVNTVTQLLDVEGVNRRSTEPFHLHFCNLQADGAYKQELLKRYGEEGWERLMITTTDRQHVDVFPREQLVYLTADSPNVLRKFDHSKVYVIGAMVDRSVKTCVSLANAKRLNIATARLPLDDYLNWELGAKCLTLDQMVRIMITVRDTGKWEEALKFVPIRKHSGFYPQQVQATSSSFKGVTNQRPWENRERQFRAGEKTFRNGGQNLYRSRKEDGFTGKDRMAWLQRDRENRPAETKVRASPKNSREAKKPWWEER